jgi:hypothetical protein
MPTPWSLPNKGCPSEVNIPAHKRTRKLTSLDKVPGILQVEPLWLLGLFYATSKADHYKPFSTQGQIAA